MVICWLTLEQSLLRRRRSIRFHFDYLGYCWGWSLGFCCCCCCVVQFIRLRFYLLIAIVIISLSDIVPTRAVSWAVKWSRFCCVFFSITILTNCARSLSDQNTNFIFPYPSYKSHNFLYISLLCFMRAISAPANWEKRDQEKKKWI